MRLPVLADESAGAAAPRRIDEEAATAMLRRAVEAGVNYVDTAYVYHDGESEPWLGRALRQVAGELFGPADQGLAELRRRVKVATKLPVWKLERNDDPERLLSEQLERLQLDSIDFYLLHGLGAGSLAKLREHDVLGWAERARPAQRRLGQRVHQRPGQRQDVGGQLGEPALGTMDVPTVQGQIGHRKAERPAQGHLPAGRRPKRIEIGTGKCAAHLGGQLAKVSLRFGGDPVRWLRRRPPDLRTFEERHDLRRAAGGVTHQLADGPPRQVGRLVPGFRPNRGHRTDKKVHRLDGQITDRGEWVAHACMIGTHNDTRARST